MSGTKVIIGAGHAGCRAVQTLRAEGWVGRICFINGEAREPYERPPLSKAVLKKEREVSDAPLLPCNWLSENDIDYRQGVLVENILRDEQSVVLSDGTRQHYDDLLIATGARPRTVGVSGIDLIGVLTLRDAADAERLAKFLQPDAALVIVGGGLIGLEVAASAISLGCRVTILEASASLLARIASRNIGLTLASAHRSSGVEIRLNSSIAEVIGDDVVRGVRLQDDTTIACDVVLICVGATPTIGIAAECGLEVDNGIVVDRFLRTSDPRILAAGDVASMTRQAQGPLRLECWKNAEDQGVAAARNMLGRNEPYLPQPWMWSDQYDLTLQVAGLPDARHATIERRLEKDDTLLAFYFLPNGVLSAISAYGALGPVAKSVKLGQHIIKKGKILDVAVLANEQTDIHQFLRSSL